MPQPMSSTRLFLYHRPCSHYKVGSSLAAPVNRARGGLPLLRPLLLLQQHSQCGALTGTLSVAYHLLRPLAKTTSHFRQQQRLLKVLQAIESDSAHLSRAVSPTEEPVPDPEVRRSASRGFQIHLASRPKGQGGRTPRCYHLCAVGVAATGVNLTSLCPSLYPPPAQQPDAHVTELKVAAERSLCTQEAKHK